MPFRIEITDTMVDAGAAAMWEEQWRQETGTMPPWPWDSDEWEEPGHTEEMEQDRKRSRACLEAALSTER